MKRTLAILLRNPLSLLGMVLIALFVVVLIIDNTSQYLRRKLS